ncbi:arginine-ornithine antiporter [Chitinimonas sp. BJB300]|uniref:arginine-ornithine antiporter n=1 Tax=Chitinimonas sp. BJB300 TaxID=1559339 RepID=UPI000C0F1FF7|nr:arginine-ornithine antiporter [Chitinimonas sp. BJB300]PHV09703.1 arginine-ornithine antiporter [Chitinimonas sp. BJB300]TSJ87076.1 arginine-ornithine antiporter [Chitinimonas sp. BJB300]TSJ87233.1 arginine-ornithine antiporter [Chitinimonas sp. BJB300]
MNTAPASVTPKPNTLGLSLLIALVVGSIIGSGIYGLPQNMASGAGAGAILIGWAISGVGMLMLARVYQILALRKPELDNGVYAYAQALSGEYVGFNSAWGYWVSAWVGNVSYLVAAFGALGYFFPVFGDGNTTAAILGASIALWVFHLLVLRGIHGAATLNGLVTLAKIVPLILFIVLVTLAFQSDVFKLDFWGHAKLGSLFDQVKSTMLVTVWVFIGIEGASVYSARARHREDVGRATIAGFLICLLLMMAVSLLSLGIYTQPELAGLKNPSMAGVLEKAVGTWGAVVVYLGLLLSVGGSFLAWTLLAAESLFTPAQSGVMPRWLTKQNAKGVPANAMWLTNGMVQIFLIVTLFSKASYLALISLSTAMILVPYLFSAAYSLLLVWRREGVITAFRRSDLIVTGLATGYCLWLLYAAGFKYLLLGALLYAPGAALYLFAKKQRTERLFTSFEWGILAFLLLLAIVAVYLLSTNKLSL